MKEKEIKEKMDNEEMKNKYSAFITEVSEILGLGKPVDIIKLCATTDLFFQPLEKRIAELGKEIAELKDEINTWKEANSVNSYKAFQLQEEKKTLSMHILELQKDKGELVDRCRELEVQIKKTKCCSNCKNCRRKFIKKNVFENTCKVEHCRNYDKWEIKENE